MKNTNEPNGAASAVNAHVMVLVEELTKLAKRNHYYCEDTWYSCPKAEDGCANEGAGDECNCGADEHNAEVAAAYVKLVDALRHKAA